MASFSEMADGSIERADKARRDAAEAQTRKIELIDEQLTDVGLQAVRYLVERGVPKTPIGRKEERLFGRDRFIATGSEWRIDPSYALFLSESGVWTRRTTVYFAGMKYEWSDSGQRLTGERIERYGLHLGDLDEKTLYFSADHNGRLTVNNQQFADYAAAQAGLLAHSRT